MAMRLAWLREMVRSNLIHVQHLEGDKNPSDVFTKILSAPRHAHLRSILMGTAVAAIALVALAP